MLDIYRYLPLFSVFCGALFVFCHKKRDKLKLLYWDKTRFALWYKRLEKEKFKWPRKHDDNTVELTEEKLHWLLDGYDITKHTPLNYQPLLYPKRFAGQALTRSKNSITFFMSC